jgi:hypothetical protein
MYFTGTMPEPASGSRALAKYLAGHGGVPVGRDEEEGTMAPGSTVATITRMVAGEVMDQGARPGPSTNPTLMGTPMEVSCSKNIKINVTFLLRSRIKVLA